MTESVTFFAAFFAGLLSFASPCVLPLVPGYLSVISGGSAVVNSAHSTSKESPQRAAFDLLPPAALFCLSFTLIFTALGLFVTGVGAPLAKHTGLMELISGIMLILLGLFFVVQAVLPNLGRTFRLSGAMRAATLSGSPVIAGAAFAVAWTPCTGPILGAVLTAASNRSGPGGGALLLATYSAGLAVPFLLSAIALEKVTSLARFARDRFKAISIISGVLLVVIGWLIANHDFSRMISWSSDLFNSLGLSGLVDAVQR